MLKADDSVSLPVADSEEARPAGKSWLFFGVITLAVLYCGFLIGLAFFTSNPVVLNPYQIRASSLIVSGSLESSNDRGVTIRIEKIWKGPAGTDSVYVRDLSAAQLRGSEVWIIPLSQPQTSPTDYTVTPGKNASSAAAKPLVYPARPDTLNKLKSLLSPDGSSL